MKKFALLLFITLNINAQTTIEKVDELLNFGDYKTALILLDKENLSFEINNKKGLIYQQVGNYAKAIENYKKALKFQGNSKTKENLGKCYQKKNKPEKAISLFEEVLKENPNNLLLQFHLAKLYKSKNKPQKAKALFKELILKDNLNPNYHYYLGSTYLNLKEKDSAKIQFLETIKIDESHYKSLFHLAKLYRKKPKKSYLIKTKINNDSSYYYLEKDLAFYPKSRNLNLLACKYHFADKNYQKTIDYFQNIENSSAENKQTLAVCYYQLKDYEKSMDYLYDLIEHRKATGKTFFYLSLIYKAEKNYELAEKYMDIAIAAEQPQLSEHYFQLGMIYQESNQLIKAISTFKKSLEDNRFNDKAQYQLALTCDSFYKNKTIAIKHYETYLKRFKYRDKQTVEFVKQRLKELKTMVFKDSEKYKKLH